MTSNIIFIIFVPDKKLFPNFYILGGYSMGSEAEESDMHIHKAVSSEPGCNLTL